MLNGSRFMTGCDSLKNLALWMTSTCLFIPLPIGDARYEFLEGEKDKSHSGAEWRTIKGREKSCRKFG